MSCLRCYQIYLRWYQEEINSVIFIIPPWNLVFNNPQILSLIISRILWWWIFRSLHIPAPETFSISESGTSQVFGSLTFYQLSWEKNCLDFFELIWTSWWCVQVYSQGTLFFRGLYQVFVIFCFDLHKKAKFIVYWELILGAYLWYLSIFSECLDIPVVT